MAKLLADESIDVLVNNADIYPGFDKKSFGHTDYAEWAQTFRINAMAPLKMVKAFTTQITRSRQKTMVMITSKMGSIADNSGGGSYLYRSSKAALNIIVKNLAIDLKPIGITAIVMHPGWVKTDMGGPNALISTGQSVTGMRQVISKLTMTELGEFLAMCGRKIPW